MLEKFRFKEYDSLLTHMATEPIIENFYKLSKKHDSIFNSSLKLDTIKTVGYNSVMNGEEKKILITFQYEFDNQITLAISELIKVKNKLFLSRIGFQSIPAPLEQINQFTFSQKSFTHYLVFSFLILQPLFVIATLVICFFSDINKKILWSIIIVISIGKFLFNWTSGANSFNIFAFNIFFGFGLTTTSPFSPWIINLAFPIGAIVFWIVRKKLINNKALHNPRLNPDRLNDLG